MTGDTRIVVLSGSEIMGRLPSALVVNETAGRERFAIRQVEVKQNIAKALSA